MTAFNESHVLYEYDLPTCVEEYLDSLGLCAVLDTLG